MKKGIVITIALILTIFLFSCSGEAPVSVGNSDTYNIPGNEIVGNEKDVGYISIKLPPINGSSKSVSNDEIKTAVGDYTLVLMSDKHTSTSLIYSEQENGFEKVALPVGTYQLVLTAEAVGNTVGSGTLRTTVGIAYTEGVVIEEFKMTKVSMTLSAPELVLEMPEEDIYINSSIVPRVKFSIKGLPSRSNSYVHYEPYIFQEIQKNDNPYLDLVVNGSWKNGVYGEFVDLPCSAPSTEGNYIFGIAVRVGIGYADGNNNVLVGNFRFIGYGTGYNESDAYRYYNDNCELPEKVNLNPIYIA